MKELSDSEEKKKDIRRFVEEGLSHKVEMYMYENLSDGCMEFMPAIDGDCVSQIEIKSTHSMYLQLWGRGESELVAYRISAKENSDDPDYIMPAWFCRAYDIDMDELKDICEEYRLDIKLEGWESGQMDWYAYELEFLDDTGEVKILQNNARRFKTWEGWLWNTSMPLLGG